MPGSPLPSPVSAAQDKSPSFSSAAIKSPKRWKGEGDMGGLPTGDEFKNEATLRVSNGAAMSPAKQKDTSASFKDTAGAISQPSKAKKASENERKMKPSPPAMPGSPLPFSVSATQEKSPPFSTAAVKNPKTWKGEGEMGDLLAGDDESKNEATLGSSNGGAMSPAKQENSASFKDTAEAISQLKAKMVAKNQRKMKLSKEERKALRSPQEQQEGASGDPVNLLDGAAFFAANYGNVPLELFQTSPTSPRSWTEVSELIPDTVGRTVLIRGWAQAIRSVGKKVTFLILRDGLSTVQCVLVGGAEDMVRFARALPKESFIEVHGFVTLPNKPPSTTQPVEVSIEKLFCISRSTKSLPFNFQDAARMDENLPHVALDTRLNYRSIDLRTPTNQAIFRIQSAVSHKFTEFLLSEGFLCIHTPKITPGISEGGSSVFRLNYVNGQAASLAQSPQLYKQMAINSGLKKVFEVCTVFRAEKSNTHRHLCEYVGLHMEMEIKEHYFEVCNVLGALFVDLFDHLAEKYASELEIVRNQFPSEPLKYHKETLKLRYAEGIDMLKDSGFEIEHYDDLSTRAEKRLGQLVREKYNTDFFILYEFPLAVRPFYTMPCFENQKYSNSFDAFIRGEEVVSGSQRIHSPELLSRRINDCGLDHSSLKDFTNSFLHGAPPRGGFGAGLERVVMLYCGLPNIRQASLFPRDPQRLAP